MITKTEETTLVLAAQAGDERAMEALLKEHAPMVHGLANGFPETAVVEHADLVQEGLAMLAETVLILDTATGNRLTTVAYKAIQREMSKAVAGGRQLAVPARTHQRYAAAWANGVEYDEALENALASGMGLDTFHALYATEAVGSMDERDEDGLTMYDTLVPSTSAASAADGVYSLVADLPDEEREIITMAFGLEAGSEPLSDNAISTRTGLSRATVQRRRTSALTMMKEMAQDV